MAEMNARVIRSFRQRVGKPNENGCMIWKGAKTKSGYGQVCVSAARPRITLYAHRVAWILAHGDVDAKLFVCHKCDTPSCVNPDHLFLGTCADNVKDMVRKGRSAKGERHSHAKLTDDEVREIRRLRQDGWLQRDVAKRFGVAPSQISMITHGKTWKHVK